FQAEDGIRDRNVTGVQTCALPILDGAHRHRARSKVNIVNVRAQPEPANSANWSRPLRCASRWLSARVVRPLDRRETSSRWGKRKIGRASCRERVWSKEDGG